MNNLTIGGRDGSFTYYETIGGGFGARPDRDGMDGVQVGMTNTLNTPVEALEAEYPLRVERYALRPDSGGRGRFDGGDGLERSVTVETDATVSCSRSGVDTVREALAAARTANPARI